MSVNMFSYDGVGGGLNIGGIQAMQTAQSIIPTDEPQTAADRNNSRPVDAAYRERDDKKSRSQGMLPNPVAARAFLSGEAKGEKTFLWGQVYNYGCQYSIFTMRDTHPIFWSVRNVHAQMRYSLMRVSKTPIPTWFWSFSEAVFTSEKLNGKNKK